MNRNRVNSLKKSKWFCFSLILLCLVMGELYSGFQEKSGIRYGRESAEYFSKSAASENGRSMTAGADAVLAAQKETDAGFSLTKEEEAYLLELQKRTITFGISESSAYLLKDQTVLGTAVPLLEILENEFGLTVEVVSGSRKENQDRLLNGKLDFMYGVPAEPGETDAVMTDGTVLYLADWLYTDPMYLAAADGNEFRAESLRLGLPEGFGRAEEIAEYLDAAEILHYAVPEELFRDLAAGRIDAAVIAESFRESMLESDGMEIICGFSQFSDYYTFGTADAEYVQLLELFHRYLTEAEEGQELRRRICSEKQHFLMNYLLEAEGDLICAVKEEYETVRYALGSTDSLPFFYQQAGERTGILEELLQFITDYTGILFERIDELDGAEAAAALDENEIQLLAGWLENPENSLDFDFSPALAETALVPVVISTQLFEKEQIAYCYWGAKEDAMPFLSGTIFDGRTLSFDSEAAMFQALQNGEVGGILVKKSCLDFYNFTSDTEKYQVAAGILIPVQEGIAYNKSNELLNTLMNRLISVYRLTHPDYEAQWEQAEEDYRSFLRDEYSRQQEKELFVWKAAAGALLAAVLVMAVIGLSRNGKKGSRKNEGYTKKAAGKELRKRAWNEEEENTEKICRNETEKNRRKKRMDDTEESRRKNRRAAVKKNKWKNAWDDVEKGAEQSKAGAMKPSRLPMFDSMKQAESGQSSRTEITEKEKRKGADTLTGLAGGHSSQKEIREILERYPETQAVFAYLDLKKLREINAEYGYQAGDEILVSFSESLKTLELDENTVVFRMDGDKFGAFRGNLKSDLDYRLFLGELQSLSAQIRAQGKLVCAAYRCSTAIYGKDADNLKELMKCADAALGFAKQQGCSFAAWGELKQ